MIPGSLPRLASGVDGILLDLLMAVMDSVAVWVAAAGERNRGLEWRDAVTARMRQAPAYEPYDDLVERAANELGLPSTAAAVLITRWGDMDRFPDATALDALRVPYGFVTNTSGPLAALAAQRARLAPRFTLSAEEAGVFKPSPAIYEEACRRLATAPPRTLFVAGSPYDADGAHGAGLRTVLVARRSDLPPPRAGIPVVGSLTEVVRALQGPSIGSDN
jgi:HAD superfamily hydrolase (TIGR01493 family)